MRTIQRIVRRAGLPASYSKGFNPHMSLSLAQPLAVGVYSSGDYMDLELEEERDTEEIIEKLNESSPIGIKFLKAVKVISEDDRKLPQSMALLDAARYTIKIKSLQGEKATEEFKELIKMPEWVTSKKSKKGIKQVDIKPMIKELKYWNKDNELIINALISCGSRENLSAELLSSYISDNLKSSDKEAFIEISREEMYTLKNNKLVSLLNYVS